MIASYVRIYFILMVAVIAERVKNLCQIQMGQLPANLFWPGALPPQFDYCSNRRARAPDDGLSTENQIVASNV